jgi:formate hydrogenlyase subunit 6/NADH:ubiquinone oxidoreductase subunit I
MLRKTRIILAAIFYIGITLLFLDFTGTLHTWFGWMAKIQLLPALLALNTGIVALLALLTLLFGRIYCSVICPLGVMQDIFAWFGKKAKKNRYFYSLEKKWLRYIMLVLFIISLLVGGGILAKLIAPYSAYGRIANNLLAPLWQWGNNGLAYLAERAESYAFYETEVWIKSGLTFGIAIATLIIIGILSWRSGRTWCNTICPVGTILGFVSRFSWFKPVIDTSKCNGCGLCARNCKAACINSKEHSIDYSRCVVCMDCIESCKKGAIKYVRRPKKAASTEESPSVDTSRRAFLTTSAIVATTTAIKAQEKKVDGGLAIIEDKVAPERQTHLVPPGALSARNFAQHCTACQLCVSACPNGVLSPSTVLTRLMQPEMSYERGYCRPECTKCSDVCPTGAIRPITRENKSSTQIGHAVWIKKNCIPLTNGDSCGNCARHCPTGAIQMVPSEEGNRRSPRIPAINVERCIGCGACENLCPARPFSAIYVEGHERHKEI